MSDHQHRTDDTRSVTRVDGQGMRRLATGSAETPGIRQRSAAVGQRTPRSEAGLGSL